MERLVDSRVSLEVFWRVFLEIVGRHKRLAKDSLKGSVVGAYGLTIARQTDAAVMIWEYCDDNESVGQRVS